MHMNIITKLYQRNNVEIPEGIVYHLQKTFELHYKILLDKTKKEEVRYNTNKLLLQKKAYIDYNKLMFNVVNPYSPSAILSWGTDSKRTIETGIFYKTGNPNNIPLKELKKYGQTTDFQINDKFNRI